MVTRKNQNQIQESNSLINDYSPVSHESRSIHLSRLGKVVSPLSPLSPVVVKEMHKSTKRYMILRHLFVLLCDLDLDFQHPVGGRQ